MSHQSPAKRQRKSNITSPFSDLPSVLFQLICTYLSLKCKCRNFPLLSKSFHGNFQPELCCRGPIELVLQYDPYMNADHLDICENQDLMRCYRQIPVVPYIRCSNELILYLIGIANLCKKMPEVIGLLLDNLSAALNNPQLRSLYIDELVQPNEICISVCVVHFLIDIPPSKLRGLNTLMIHPEDHSDTLVQLNRLRYAAHKEMTIDWSGLQNCQSLRCFSFVGRLSGLRSDRNIAAILKSLPGSVTELTIQDLRVYPHIFNEALSNPSFLPFLSTVGDDPNSSNLRCDTQFFPGFQTLMCESGLPRPIEALEIVMSKGLSFESCWCLKTLSIHCPIELFLELVCMPDNQLPLLTFINLMVQPGERESFQFDISPMCTFISKRRIETASLSVQALIGSGIKPVARDAIEALAGSQSLTFLMLRSNFLVSEDKCLDLFGRDLSNLDFSGDTWHNLEKLELNNWACNSHNAMRLIKAAPKLQHLELCSSSWLSCLSIIGDTCACLQSLTLQSQTGETIMTLHQIQTLCERSVSATSFGNLTKLHLSGVKLTPDALHFLYTQLSRAPNLAHVYHDLAFEEPTYCTLYLMSLFPHLISILRANDWHKIRPKRADSGDGASYFVVPAAPDQEDDCPGMCRFRTMSDEPALDGRKSFFDHLCTLMSEDEVHAVKRWNKGDYSRRITRRK